MEDEKAKEVTNLEDSVHVLPHTIEEGEINWLNIPYHLLGCIADKLIEVKDYIRFGAVCRSWLSVYTESLCRRPHTRQLPLLMLPNELNTADLQTRSLYSVSEKRVLTNFQLKVPHNVFCRGSSQGWLVTLHPNLLDVRLLNPFMSTDNEIKLPPLTTFPHMESEIYNEGFLVKAVLSSNPASNPSNYTVMAIYGQFNRLAFFKPGDSSWTSLDFEYMAMEDVIYYKYQFYAVDFVGDVFACDVNHPHPKLVKVASSRPENEHVGKKKYLVDSYGNLLQIRRSIPWSEDTDSYYTSNFEIFKLDSSTSSWSQLNRLDNQAIFLGDNNSMSLSSLDFLGCKANCIYFTDDNIEEYGGDNGDGPRDLGVFNFEDSTIVPHYPMKSNIIVPAPIWIEPTLQPRCK